MRQARENRPDGIQPGRGLNHLQPRRHVLQCIIGNVAATPPDPGSFVWNARRRVIGNLLPIVIAAPFGVVGLFMMYRAQIILGPGLWVFSLCPVVLWFAVNWLGLFENQVMRRSLERRMGALPETRWFVGAATPSFIGWIDPHEDVGFLWMNEKSIGFSGERYQIEIPRSSLTAIRFKPNVHSLIGLGRWVSIEALIDGKPAQLMIEPREAPTLMGNRKLSRTVRDRLRSPQGH